MPRHRSLTGSLQQVSKLPDELDGPVLPGQAVCDLDKGGYWLAFRHRESPAISHFFDLSFGGERAASHDVETVWPQESEFERLHSQFAAGSIAISGSGVVYAPSVYRGQLYSPDTESQGKGLWEANDAFVGRRSTTPLASEPYPDLTYVHGLNGSIYAGIINSESLGLFRLADGRYLHIIRRADAGEYWYAAEVWGPDGALEAEGVLMGGDWLKSKFLYPATLDQLNRLYLIERSSQPVVRRVVLQIP